jgi:hypothetical protein
MTKERILAYVSISLAVFFAGVMAGNTLTEGIIHSICNEKNIVRFDNTYFICKEVHPTNLDIVQ